MRGSTTGRLRRSRSIIRNLGVSDNLSDNHQQQQSPETGFRALYWVLDPLSQTSTWQCLSRPLGRVLKQEDAKELCTYVTSSYAYVTSSERVGQGTSPKVATSVPPQVRLPPTATGACQSGRWRNACQSGVKMCSVKIVQRCCQMCSVRSFWMRKSRRSRATPGSDPSHLLPVPVFLSALSVFPKTNKHPFPSRLRFHLATLIMSDQTLQFAGVRSMLFSSSVLMLQNCAPRDTGKVHPQSCVFSDSPHTLHTYPHTFRKSNHACLALQRNIEGGPDAEET